jgi:hypothetical protein
MQENWPEQQIGMRGKAAIYYKISFQGLQKLMKVNVFFQYEEKLQEHPKQFLTHLMSVSQSLY